MNIAKRNKLDLTNTNEIDILSRPSRELYLDFLYEITAGNPHLYLSSIHIEIALF